MLPALTRPKPSPEADTDALDERWVRRNARIFDLTGSCEPHTPTPDGTRAPIKGRGGSRDPATRSCERRVEPIGPTTGACEPATGACEPATGVCEPATEACEPATAACEPVITLVDSALGSLEPMLGGFEPVTEPFEPVITLCDSVLGSVDRVTGSVIAAIGSAEPVFWSVEPPTHPRAVEQPLRALAPAEHLNDRVPRRRSRPLSRRAQTSCRCTEPTVGSDRATDLA